MIQLELPMRPGSWGRPAQGEPCTGCGYCCRERPCFASTVVLGCIESPCPALRWHDGRYWCGLAEFEREAGAHGLLKKAVMPEILGFSTGCGVVMDGGGVTKDGTMGDLLDKLELLYRLVSRRSSAMKGAHHGRT